MKFSLCRSFVNVLDFFPKMGREIQLGFYQNVSYFIFTCQTEADYKISGPW